MDNLTQILTEALVNADKNGSKINLGLDDKVIAINVGAIATKDKVIAIEYL